MMSQRIALSGLLALALTACSAPSIVLTPRLSRLDIDGNVGVQQGSSLSGKASVDALGIDADSSVIGGRVDIKAGGHWTFSAQRSSHDGSGVADAELSSGSTTINIGDPVTSQLELGLYSGSVTFDLIPTDMIEVGIGLGISALDFNASFRDDLTSQEVKTNEVVPVPHLTGRVAFDAGPLEVSGLVNWIHLSYRDTSATYLDVDTMARLRVLGNSDRVAGHVAIGYRFMNVKADYESDGNAVDVDVDFTGPWIGLSLSF
ncbi:MAG: hypothetical protein JNL28_07610 [Planctomycetes bacterium]|nr:hypothetical protein [Planctomycetota bacterium]